MYICIVINPLKEKTMLFSEGFPSRAPFGIGKYLFSSSSSFHGDCATFSQFCASFLTYLGCFATKQKCLHSCERNAHNVRSKSFQGLDSCLCESQTCLSYFSDITAGPGSWLCFFSSLESIMLELSKGLRFRNAR